MMRALLGAAPISEALAIGETIGLTASWSTDSSPPTGPQLFNMRCVNVAAFYLPSGLVIVSTPLLHLSC